MVIISHNFDLAIPQKLSNYGTALIGVQGVMSRTGAVTTKTMAALKTLTAAQVENILVTKDLTEEQFKSLLGLTTLTEEEKAYIRTKYQVITADTTDIASKNTLTFSWKAMTVAIWDNVKAMWAWLTTNPVGWCVLAAAAIGAVAGAVILYNKHIEKTIQKAQELEDAYKEAADSISDSMKTVTSMEAEFNKLSKGVDEHGKNVSLTADEYDRYREIVDQLIDINPTLIKGYNEQGQAIVENNTALSETIELLKKKQKLELDEATTDANNWDILKGKRNAYNEAIKDAEKAEQKLANVLTSALLGTTKRNADNSIVTLGGISSEDAFRQIADLYGVYDDVKKNLYASGNSAGKAIGTLGAHWSTLFSVAQQETEDFAQITKDNIDSINNYLDGNMDSTREFNQALQSWMRYDSAAESASKAYQSHMRTIAQAADGYDELSTGARDFLNEWINTFELTGDETKESSENITTSIWEMVDTLNNIPQLKAVLDVDYELLTGGAREDFNEAVKKLLADLVASGNLTKEAAAQIKLAIGITYVDPETGKEYDKHGWLQAQLFDGLLKTDLKFNLAQLGSLSIKELEYALTLDPSAYESWEDFFAAIKAGASEVVEALSDLTKAVNVLTTFEEAFDALAEALDEFAENGVVSADTVSNLLEAFGDTDAMRDFLKTLGEEGVTSDQVKEKLNALGNEYLKSAEFIALLDENTVGWVGSVLESKGVVNGAEVALKQYRRMTVEADIATKNFTSSLLRNNEQLTALGMNTQARGLITLIRMMEKVVDNPASSAEQKANAQKYIDQYTDQLNALESWWDDQSLEWNTDVSTNDSSDYSDNEFEKLYNKWKHEVETEKKTLKEFYDWFGSDEGFRKYFDPNDPQEVENYRKYFEEVFNGVREQIDDVFADGEHKISLLEFDEGNEQAIVNEYERLGKLAKTEREKLEGELRETFSAKGWSEEKIQQEIEGNSRWQELRTKELDYAEKAKTYAFQTEYDKRKHLVEMEQMTLKEFYDWLDSEDKGYKAYFDEGSEEYLQYAEEVFSGLRDLYDKDLDAREKALESLGDYEGSVTITNDIAVVDTNTQEIVNGYRKLIDDVEKELKKVENNPAAAEYAQSLRDRIQGYKDAIEEILADIDDFEEDWDADEHQIFLWEQAGGHEADILERYRRMQDEAHAVAESFRKIMRESGMEEWEIEQSPVIQNLSKLWWEYEDNIKDVFDSVSDVISDHINDIEHQIEVLEHVGGETGSTNAQMISLYNEELGYLADQLEHYTALFTAYGYTPEQIAGFGVIQELQKSIMSCESSLKDLIDDMNDGLYDSMESLLELTVDMLEKEKELEKEVLQDQIDD